MSIMCPTIFALGIFGLGERAKKASAFIVMAIMGGAVLPKLMGAVADKWDMSRGFIVPMFCFAFVAFYGFNWSKFSNAGSLHHVTSGAGPYPGPASLPALQDDLRAGAIGAEISLETGVHQLGAPGLGLALHQFIVRGCHVV